MSNLNENEVTLPDVEPANSEHSEDSADDDVASLDHMSEDDNGEVRFYRQNMLQKMDKGKRKECEAEMVQEKEGNAFEEEDNPLLDQDPSNGDRDFNVFEEIRQCSSKSDLTGYVSDDSNSDKGYATPVYDSEDERSCPKHNKWPVFDPKTEWKQQEPTKGMLFADSYELRHCITNYAIAKGREIWFEKMSKRVVLAKCKEGCTWRLYASLCQMNNSMQVKSYNPKHNERVCVLNFNSKLVTSRWMAREYATDIRANPSWKLEEFRKAVLQRHRTDVTEVQCSRARKFGVGEIESVLIKHYAKLWDYREELLRSNPGSTVVLEGVNADGGALFDKMYICFDALKRGWLSGCRPVIGLDGCFLKNFCKGQLLCAVGRDGNNHMFPIAWAVVQSESNETWGWFLKLLNEDIGYDNGDGLTFISDQQKGLLNGLNQVFPNAEHRNCARHIYANFRKHYNGVGLRNLFWKAAKSSTEVEFLTVMDEIKKASNGAYQYLKTSKPEHWCRAYFSTMSCSDNVENNLSETFNSFIVEARKKPIISMLEDIRQSLVNRLAEKKQYILNQHDPLCPRIRKKLEVAKDEFKHWNASSNGVGGFEVRKGLDGYTVDLHSRTCSCRMWQLLGIPCPHVVAAICFIHDDCDRFVSTWFLTEHTLKAYDYTLQPVNGQNLWPRTGNVPLLPPKQRRSRGRPKTMRHKEWSERRGKTSKKKTVEAKNNNECSRKGRKMRCTNCNEWDHNSRRCKNPRVEGDKELEKRRNSNKKRKRSNNNEGQEVEVGEVQMETEPVQMETEPVQMETEPPVQMETEPPVQMETEPVQMESEPPVQIETESNQVETDGFEEPSTVPMKLQVRRGRPKKKEKAVTDIYVNSRKISPTPDAAQPYKMEKHKVKLEKMRENDRLMSENGR